MAAWIGLGSKELQKGTKGMLAVVNKTKYSSAQTVHIEYGIALGADERTAVSFHQLTGHM